MAFNKTVLLISFCVLLATRYHLGLSDISCDDSYSCANSTLSTSSSSSDIDCKGSFSCREAISISTSGSGSSIHCYGSYSCYQSKSLTTNSVSSSASIDCYGLFSCANIEYMYTRFSWIGCYGEKSCVNSLFDGLSPNTYLRVYCYGGYSCVNVTAYNRNLVYFVGYRSGENGLFINIDGNVAIYYNFNGKESGKNATIVCGTGNTCEIQCYGDACNELTVKCVEKLDNGTIVVQGYGNNCSNISPRCDYADRSDFCPDGFVGAVQEIEIPSLDIPASNWNNSGRLCDVDDVYEQSSIVCGNSQECVSTSDFVDTNKTICCSGYQGCYGATEITTTIGYYNDDIGVRCDGYQSCIQIGGTIGSSTGLSASDLYFSACKFCNIFFFYSY